MNEDGYRVVIPVPAWFLALLLIVSLVLIIYAVATSIVLFGPDFVNHGGLGTESRQGLRWFRHGVKATLDYGGVVHG